MLTLLSYSIFYFRFPSHHIRLLLLLLSSPRRENLPSFSNPGIFLAFESVKSVTPENILVHHLISECKTLLKLPPSPSQTFPSSTKRKKKKNPIKPQFMRAPLANLTSINLSYKKAHHKILLRKISFIKPSPLNLLTHGPLNILRVTANPSQPKLGP